MPQTAWAASRADFAVFFGKLQRVDDALHLVHVVTRRQIVDDLAVHNLADAVDQERAAGRGICELSSVFRLPTSGIHATRISIC